MGLFSSAHSSHRLSFLVVSISMVATLHLFLVALENYPVSEAIRAWFCVRSQDMPATHAPPLLLQAVQDDMLHSAMAKVGEDII